MISLSYSSIESYLDNIALTKQSRIEYEKECISIIDAIRKVVSLGYLTSGDAGTALKTVALNKFKSNPCIDNVRSNQLNQLKTFLKHIGYSNESASCAIRALKSEHISIHAKKVLNSMKENQWHIWITQ